VAIDESYFHAKRKQGRKTCRKAHCTELGRSPDGLGPARQRFRTLIDHSPAQLFRHEETQAHGWQPPWPVAQATDTSMGEGDAGSIPALREISDRLAAGHPPDNRSRIVPRPGTLNAPTSSRNLRRILQPSRDLNSHLPVAQATDTSLQMRRPGVRVPPEARASVAQLVERLGQELEGSALVPFP